MKPIPDEIIPDTNHHSVCACCGAQKFTCNMTFYENKHFCNECHTKLFQNSYDIDCNDDYDENLDNLK